MPDFPSWMLEEKLLFNNGTLESGEETIKSIQLNQTKDSLAF